jgi:pimeloyl-ACP methyl ester carboxylesterase
MISKETFTLGADQGLTVDHYAAENEIARALVLPGFGRTADEYFHLSAILLHHRVSVVIPDFRFHPGRSAGTIRDFRLSAQAQDVATILDRFETGAVLATSLSFPPTLRLLADRGWRGQLVGIVPVVGPADTLLVVTGFNCHDPDEDCSPARMLDIDGFAVSAELVSDATRDGMRWVKETMADAERFGGKLTMIVGERDTWVELAQARMVAEAAPDCDLVVLDSAGHDFGRSVRRARAMFQTAAATFLRAYGIPGNQELPLDVVIRARQELRETDVTSLLDGS